MVSFFLQSDAEQRAFFSEAGLSTRMENFGGSTDEVEAQETPERMGLEFGNAFISTVPLVVSCGFNF